MKAKTGDMEPDSKEFFKFSEAAGQEQDKRLIDKLQEGSRNYRTKQGKRKLLEDVLRDKLYAGGGALVYRYLDLIKS